jgi:hypothetical protein
VRVYGRYSDWRSFLRVGDIFMAGGTAVRGMRRCSASKQAEMYERDNDEGIVVDREYLNI